MECTYSVGIIRDLLIKYRLPVYFLSFDIKSVGKCAKCGGEGHDKCFKDLFLYRIIFMFFTWLDAFIHLVAKGQRGNQTRTALRNKFLMLKPYAKLMIDFILFYSPPLSLCQLISFLSFDPFLFFLSFMNCYLYKFEYLINSKTLSVADLQCPMRQYF